MRCGGVVSALWALRIPVVVVVVVVVESNRKRSLFVERVPVLCGEGSMSRF